MIGVTKHRHNFRKSILQNHLSSLALIRAKILTEYYVTIIKKCIIHATQNIFLNLLFNLFT